MARKRRKLNKYEAVFLTGGWLEVLVWNLLTRHAEPLGIWDVRLGMEAGRCGDQSGNDFDVAFMHNHGLSMVECKTGPQEHDADGGDTLYKVEAVTRQFWSPECQVLPGNHRQKRFGQGRQTDGVARHASGDVSSTGSFRRTDSRYSRWRKTTLSWFTESC